MIEWFLSNWSNSDGFKVGACVVAAVVSSLLVSSQRSRLFSAFITGLLAVAKMPVHSARAAAGRAVRRARAERQKRETEFRGALRAGCAVSLVERSDENGGAVRRGRVAWVRNDTDALIDWETATHHPFTGHAGLGGNERTTHDAELIFKEHRLGDRGVIADTNGRLWVADGWSILSWPTAPSPWWVRLPLWLDDRRRRRLSRRADRAGGPPTVG